MYTTSSNAISEDQQYEGFLKIIGNRFAQETAKSPHLFTTTATGMFDAFLSALPSDRQKHYTCNACRRFVDRFGGLVTIDETGSATSVLWSEDEAPDFFKPSIRAMIKILMTRANVNGVFLNDESVWGLPVNRSSKPPGVWQHMACEPRPALVFKSTTLTAFQVMAEKLQDFGTLSRGLAEFKHETVRQALSLLTTGALYRSEKHIGVASWLLKIHDDLAATRHEQARNNILWLAVASAPAGFCHVRSSMIGTLLEDIQAGLPFHEVKRRFDEKMDPLKYQRPVAPPTEGNIAQAEAIVQRLKSAGALDRRFAKLEDVQALWVPKPKQEPTKGEGAFGHLKARGRGAQPAAMVEQPAVTMTWEKFARTVLPDAESMEFFVPYDQTAYVGMVTAANPDAPPILQWDHEERRNAVSWYFYSGGSPAQRWNLKSGVWHPVTAVTLKPSMWHGSGITHQGEAVFFLLQGARDLAYASGAGFFVECLKSEYHGVRRTMEAYMKSAVVADAEHATACGIALQKGSPWGYQFRVMSKSTLVTYKLDRWD